MRAYTLNVLGSMLAVTWAFTISGAANAEEMYFTSFLRNSVIHFRDVGEGAEFVSETVAPITDKALRDVTLGPDGKLYVASLQDEAVLRFDPATDTFDTFGGDPNNFFFASGISSGAQFSGPAALVFGGPNNDLWVAGGDDTKMGAGKSYIKRFDGTTGAPIGPDPFVSEGMNEPNTLVFHPDGDLLAGGQLGNIRRVDPVTGDVSIFAQVGNITGDGPRVKGMVFSPDESTLFVGTDDGGSFFEFDSTYRLDATTGERITDPPDPFVPAGLNATNLVYPFTDLEVDFSTDGSTLLVGSRGQQPSGFGDGPGAFFRFDPNTGDAVDGFDQDGAINCYICDISTETSQGGPGSGPHMSPQRIVALPSTDDPELDGDFNDDGRVDVDDLNLVLFNWDKTVPPPEEWVNHIPEGPVAVNELNAVLFNWGSMAPLVASVPEPGSGLLVVCGLLAIGIHRCSYRQTGERPLPAWRL